MTSCRVFRFPQISDVNLFVIQREQFHYHWCKIFTRDISLLWILLFHSYCLLWLLKCQRPVFVTPIENACLVHWMCRIIAQSQEMSTSSNFKGQFMRRVRHIFGLTLFWMHNFGNRKPFMKVCNCWDYSNTNLFLWKKYIRNIFKEFRYITSFPGCIIDKQIGILHSIIVVVSGLTNGVPWAKT